MIQRKVIEENRTAYDAASDIDEFMIYNKKTHYVYQHYQKNIKGILSKIKKEKISVLDIASGSGGVSKIFFEDKRCIITAVDLSKKQLEFYAKKVDKKRLRTYCMSVEDFCKENKKKYDVVIIASALHHFYDYKKVLAEILDSCKPEFIYIAREPVAENEKKSFLCKIFVYIDDCIQWPYNYYKRKDIPFYKRSIVIIFTPILSPFLRILEPYGYNPINFIMRKRKKISARYVELYDSLDQKGLCNIIKKKRYTFKTGMSPAFFFKGLSNLSLKMNVHYTHFEITAEKIKYTKG
jgi:SAM-dependent methyltransferase